MAVRGGPSRQARQGQMKGSGTEAGHELVRWGREGEEAAERGEVEVGFGLVRIQFGWRPGVQERLTGPHGRTLPI